MKTGGNKMDDKEYADLLEINKLLNGLTLFPSLGWTWCFDIIKDIHENEQFEDVREFAEECVPSGVTLREIIDKFYLDIDNLGLNMDFGGELLEEVIRDWMRENEFLIQLDSDGWLE